MLNTPYYLIDERKLLRNLKIIARVRKRCGARVVLALKCFSTWGVFGLMKKYMDGTTSSSLYEARLGHEKFGKETHAYCVAYSEREIKEVSRFADKIIFNSASQLKRFYPHVRGRNLGVRINPLVSYSHFDLADPARKYSRLGVRDKKELLALLPLIQGVMFHFNYENDDFKDFSSNLDHISRAYGEVLRAVRWVSLGGGIYFTKKGYPVEKFCDRIKKFSKQFNVQVYLEPGESAITGSAQLVTKVLDIVHNTIDIAIVDASIEAHMLDLLTYRIKAKMKDGVRGRFTYMIAGRSCLAGDVFGTYRFRTRPEVGSIVKIDDAAGYTIVKKNWFNGLAMPSIVIKRLNGSYTVARRFTYKEFVESVS
jgi:carboxynorspermidine decarboxylase